MQLENPKQQRALDDIIASLPETNRVALASRLVKIAATARRQSQHDVEIVESVCRVLSHPNQKQLADKLKELLK